MLIKIFANDVLPAVSAVKTPSVTGFLPMVGRNYSGQLMVVGRAVNGWTEDIAPSDLRSADRCLEYATKVYDDSVKSDVPGECPMAWVTKQWGAAAAGDDYNTKRSAFWRTIKAVVSRIGISDVNDTENPWPSHLVWSNLYKVSPAEGNNPNRALQNAQFKGCAKLLKWELEKYWPQRVLFLTGLKWADPFLKQAWQTRQDRPRPEGPSFVEAVGHVPCDPHALTYVVACHPQGKNEADWVNAVAAAFGKGVPSGKN